MRKVFTALAMVLMLAVVVQIFLAGAGAFDTAPNDEAFQPHEALGYAILLFALLLTLLAALVRMPGRLIGMTGLVAGLTVLQPVIAVIAGVFDDTGDTTSTAGGLVFGLHAVNALVIMAVVGMIVRQARAMSNAHARTSLVDADDAASSGAAGTAEAAS